MGSRGSAGLVRRVALHTVEIVEDEVAVEIDGTLVALDFAVAGKVRQHEGSQVELNQGAVVPSFLRRLRTGPHPSCRLSAMATKMMLDAIQDAAPAVA